MFLDEADSTTDSNFFATYKELDSSKLRLHCQKEVLCMKYASTVKGSFDRKVVFAGNHFSRVSKSKVYGKYLGYLQNDLLMRF